MDTRARQVQDMSWTQHNCSLPFPFVSTELEMRRLAKGSKPFKIASKFFLRTSSCCRLERANVVSTSWEGIGRIAPAGTKLQIFSTFHLSSSHNFCRSIQRDPCPNSLLVGTWTKAKRSSDAKSHFKISKEETKSQASRKHMPRKSAAR